jgi:UDP-N-acetyl-D-mannosaminuronic acid dehydrogenase
MNESVAIIGGAGHVGLPLAISFANAGVKTQIYDVNVDGMEAVMKGKFPFKEIHGKRQLEVALRSGNLLTTSNPEKLAEPGVIITIIGTPVDNHLNPDPDAIRKSLQHLTPFLRNGQLLVLRSTIFPGVTASVERLLLESNLQIDVVTAPERIIEGFAFEELPIIPQIIGARSKEVFLRAKNFFQVIVNECLESTPEQAELAKLFSNSWRYMRFAAANELYGIALQAGQNFETIRRLMMHNYPRSLDFPKPGFAAGPCLPKDSLQLIAFSRQSSPMISVAYSINENLPNIIVNKISKEVDLQDLTVGILGMAFKPESDDPRSSLSYKLKKLLLFQSKKVICSDPFVQDDNLKTIEEVLLESDIVVVAVDHEAYRGIQFKQQVFKVWNL